jgi:uncharacterized membrane protein
MRTLHAATLATAMFAPMAAQAGFNICNQTDEAVSVAIGYIEGEIWYASGWLNLDPRTCGVALTGNLNNQFYYVRAEGAQGSLWDGDYLFCTSKASFKLASTEGCASASVEREGFFQVDTEEAVDFTLDLTQ